MSEQVKVRGSLPTQVVEDSVNGGQRGTDDQFFTIPGQLCSDCSGNMGVSIVMGVPQNG